MKENFIKEDFLKSVVKMKMVVLKWKRGFLHLIVCLGKFSRGVKEGLLGLLKK